jgi:hypothetical protein
VLTATAAAAALLVAGVSGWYPYANLTPGRPVVTLRLGASAEVEGVRYRLDRFVVAPTLPPEDPKDPPVVGPAGSALVLVVVEQTVLDRSVRLDEHFCDTSLVDDEGTNEWPVDSDFTSQIARPPSYGCSDSDRNPLRYDVPRDTGFSFAVPADAVGHLSALLHVSHGPTLALRP